MQLSGRLAAAFVGSPTHGPAGAAPCDDAKPRLGLRRALRSLCGSFRHAPGLKGAPSVSAEESEMLGVSVAFLQTQFLEEVEAAFGAGADPDYYAVCEEMLLGPRGRGARVVCPRDRRPGSSYVDALDPLHTGRATLMLSWVWQYSVHTVVDTLGEWCTSKQLDPSKVFVWQCALCCNQYRVQERRDMGEWLPFAVFHSIFEQRVKGIGLVLAILSPWQEPVYLQRAWCIFELWTAMQTPGVQLEVIGASSQTQPMRREIANGWLMKQGTLTGSWVIAVDIRSASTSCPHDKLNILRCIDPAASGFDDADSDSLTALNDYVQARISDWCTDAIVDSLCSSQEPPVDMEAHLMSAMSACAMLTTNAKDDIEEGIALAAKVLAGAEQAAASSAMAKSHTHACVALMCAYFMIATGDAIDGHARVMDVIGWNAVLPPEKAPEDWELFALPMPDLFLAEACVAQGRFADAEMLIEKLEPNVLARREQSDGYASRFRYRYHHLLKARALHGLGRRDEAEEAMQRTQAIMEDNGEQQWRY